jgi:hypothetical protein
VVLYGTERKLAELMGRDLRELNLVVPMIDGVHFAEHLHVERMAR